MVKKIEVILKYAAGHTVELTVPLQAVLEAGIIRYNGDYFRYVNGSGRIFESPTFEETKLVELRED